MKDPTVCFGGVDWATDAHAVAVVDCDGHLIDEFDVDHSAEGLEELCRRMRKHGVSRVAIERPNGPVVDALLEAHFEVVVVASRSVKALRERYGLAGNKSDRSVPTCWPTACAPMGTAGGTSNRTPQPP